MVGAGGTAISARYYKACDFSPGFFTEGKDETCEAGRVCGR